ncbi:MAG: glycosyltransferase family 2 protein [bacterium]|nr:glycosyltransferase family 2 protein [bacterium]
MKRIAIVMPLYNAGDILFETLNALGEQTLSDEQYQVVIVDDNSQDNSYTVANRFRQRMSYLDIQLIKHTTNRGTYAAYNSGASLCNSEYVLFLDQDCVAHTHLLEKHLETHNQHKQPIAVIGRFIWHKAMKVGRHLAHFRPIENTLLVEPEDINDLQLGQFITGNCSLNYSAFHQVGCFNEDYTYGFGDTDLGLRWRRHGFKIAGNLDAIVYHFHPMTFADQLQRKRKIGMQYPTFCQQNPDVVEGQDLVSVYQQTYVDNLFKALLEYFFHLGHREQLGIASESELKFADCVLKQNWEQSFKSEDRKE